MARRVLTDEEVAGALAARSASDWALIDGKLTRTVAAPTFVDAILLVDRVAELAESANHHPDIDIRYNKVTFALVTHDAGGITQSDVDLAAAIDEAAG
ncbi:MAG: 4a-hydroxytetrahydrobiopterin dehydratase [Acidimicrobiales bacterium]